MTEDSGFEVPVVVALVGTVVLVLVGVALVGVALVGFALVVTAVAVVLVVVGAVHVDDCLHCPLCSFSLSELANDASVADPVFRFV